jgi:hypothetical protein
MDAIVINPTSQLKYYVIILALAMSIRYDEMNKNFIKNNNLPHTPMARPMNWKIAIQPGKKVYHDFQIFYFTITASPLPVIPPKCVALKNHFITLICITSGL